MCNDAMPDLRQIEQDILVKNRVDGHELELLHHELYAGGNIDRRKADWLVQLHKRVQQNPAFERLYYRALKDHVLVDGRIDAGEACWLRKTLLTNGKLHDEERTFLHELKGEARQVSPEFEALTEPDSIAATRRWRKRSRDRSWGHAPL